MRPKRLQKSRRGIATPAAISMLTIVLVLAVAFLTVTTSAVKQGARHRSAAKAFQLAEAGVEKAIAEMNTSFGGEEYWGEEGSELGNGTFTVEVHELENPDPDLIERRAQVISHGTVNGITKSVEVVADQPKCTADVDFYDKALVSEDYVTGTDDDQCIVDGNIWYRNLIDDVGRGPEYPDSTWEEMPENVHLPQFNFGELNEDDEPISGLMLIALQQEQQDAYRHFFLNSSDLNAHKDELPPSFWFDEENQIPNVIYVTDSINLSGNYNIGGLIIVRGTTQIQEDASFGGNNTIHGVIYTSGHFNMHGGGNKPINIMGGAFCGSATLKGQPSLTYCEEYMRAIEDFVMIESRFEVISWREL